MDVFLSKKGSGGKWLTKPWSSQYHDTSEETFYHFSFTWALVNAFWSTAYCFCLLFLAMTTYEYTLEQLSHNIFISLQLIFHLDLTHH